MKTLVERLIEIEALTRELRQYVQKYGFDPKEGGLKVEACWNCGTTESGLPHGEKLMTINSGDFDNGEGYECTLCSRKMA